MLMLSRTPAARVYRSRERKNENLRRSYRSARAAQGVMAKKVQRNGSRHIYRLPIKLACEQCTFNGAVPTQNPESQEILEFLRHSAF